MRSMLLFVALFKHILAINQPYNSRTSHRGLRNNVYLPPPPLRLSNPHVVKEKYCALLRANDSTTITKIPVNMTLGKIFHYVTMEIFDTFYRTGRTGSLSIQKLSRNASTWSRLRYPLLFTPLSSHYKHTAYSFTPPMHSFLLTLCPSSMDVQ